MNALDTYQRVLIEWSDVQAHLPRLYKAAHGNVVELGVRHGKSTSALLAGVETHGGTLWSIDNDPACATVFAGHPLWRFAHTDSESVKHLTSLGMPTPVDVLFIDTEHTYDKTLRELLAWYPIMRKGGRIFLHDTDDGMTYPGVRRTIYEFCTTYKLMYWLYPESYGLGEIEC